MKVSAAGILIAVSPFVLIACGGSDNGGPTAVTPTCADVYVFAARGAGEPAGEGILGAMIDQLVATSKQKLARGPVTYPADPSDYATSVALGVSKLKSQIQAEVQACPSEKLVLLGYSQGAGVVLDALGGGGGGTLGPATAPIDASLASHVVAVIAFGDARHTAGQAYDVGTSVRSGLYPRTAAQLTVLSGQASNIHAYCDTGDQYCDGGNDPSVHGSYLQHYQTAGTQFVIGLIGS